MMTTGALARDDNDTVYGGTGSDYVHLRDGDDTAILGPGQDAACGGIGDDDLQGQGHDDKLWGGNGVDDLDGGGEVTADRCSAEDGGGSNISCEALITSVPTECPDEHPTL